MHPIHPTTAATLVSQIRASREAAAVDERLVHTARPARRREHLGRFGGFRVRTDHRIAAA